MQKFVIILFILTLLVACGGNQAESLPTTAVIQPAATIPPATETAVPLATLPTAPAATLEATPITPPEEPTAAAVAQPILPAWANLPLTNARTGETFTLADFAGKTIFVETMATWCSNCRRQLQNVREAKAQLADDSIVFITLSVETNMSDDALARYADNEGFDWLFAVASVNLLQALTDEYGRAVINPPATPHFIIYPAGNSTDLITGIESPEQLMSGLTQ
jgi:thiol-disulfide isomerase/thioredoxin